MPRKRPLRLNKQFNALRNVYARALYDDTGEVGKTRKTVYNTA